MKAAMIVLCLVYSLLLVWHSAQASLEEQELQEITIPRLMPSKIKTYPVLEALEKKLYPLRNFQKDNPNQRLERLEIAILGDKQSGSISERIHKLEETLSSWEIANSTPTKPNLHQAPIHPIISQAPQQIRPKRQIDYQYMNYRASMPIIQNIARRGIQHVIPRP